VESIKDGSTALAAYTYLGASSVIRIDYAEPSVRLDLWGGTTAVFDGLNLFGRIVDQRWRYYGGRPSSKVRQLDHQSHGADRSPWLNAPRVPPSS
jgi:hypothetical protein